MNNTDIDALSGRELDLTVALFNGYSWYAVEPDLCIVRRDTELMHPAWKRINPEDAIRAGDFDTYVPHYSVDISAAWELDGEGWRWEFEEHYKIVESPLVWARCFMPEDVYTGEARFSDFPTKASAYAVARCRAWLKAKTAEAHR